MQDGDVEVAVEQREEADHDVGDRRGEVATSAPSARSRGCYSWTALLRRGSAPASAASSVVSDRKMSSRLMRIGRSSSSPQPLPTTARASSRRTSRPLLALDLVADDAVAPVGFDDARHAGHARRARPRRRRRRRRPARTSFPSRAAARSGCRACRRRRRWPLLMMTTRWQVCETSGRMCVLRMIVWSPASSLISSRVSMICFGSRPAVGSSRISTSGLWMSACARPTRCR